MRPRRLPVLRRPSTIVTLGEAYVIQGKLDLATSQLATIKTICGTGCDEYEDLAQAIEDSKL